MIRQIIIPQQKHHVIQFPDEMIGKQVEVIAFNIADDVRQEGQEANIELPLSREDFLAHLRKTGFNANGWKFDRDEANNYDE